MNRGHHMLWMTGSERDGILMEHVDGGRRELLRVSHAI